MGVNNLTYGGKGLELTERFESCRLTAYQDQVGAWTIGYGHTGPEVMAGLRITAEKAQEYLRADVKTAEACVNRHVGVKLSQEEFDALVDFVFNAGRGAFEKSTLLHELNAGRFEAAAAQFAVWDKAAGAVVAGLLRRRQAETALFQQKPEQQEQV